MNKDSVGASTIRKLLVVVLFMIGVFSSGFYFGTNYRLNREKGTVNITRDVPAEREDLDFTLFWSIWDTLEDKYYDKGKLDEHELVYGAIQGMVASVGDPYTVFLKPEQNKLIQEDLNGSFDGVGIQIGFRGNQLAVIAPLPGSPAEKAGVEAGDYIIGISDENKGIDQTTDGMSLYEAVRLIRGESGSNVTLTLLREEIPEPLKVDIKRQSIDVPTLLVDYADEDNTIAHVTMNRFGGETVQEWEVVVADLLKNSNLEGIILDLRNNPGGYLQAANDIASDFLEVGQTVVIEEAGDKSRTEYTVERIGRLRKVKVVVLINEGSASASEILAGALRDNKKVQLVGETSFGKGTIQEPQELEHNAGLHITIARWLTPNETWVNDGGLKPDHEIEDDDETEVDEQLEKALEVINN